MQTTHVLMGGVFWRLASDSLLHYYIHYSTLFRVYRSVGPLHYPVWDYRTVHYPCGISIDGEMPVDARKLRRCTPHLMVTGWRVAALWRCGPLLPRTLCHDFGWRGRGKVATLTQTLDPGGPMIIHESSGSDLFAADLLSTSHSTSPLLTSFDS